MKNNKIKPLVPMHFSGDSIQVIIYTLLFLKPLYTIS